MKAASAWNEFWFGEASLTRLASFRILLMLLALYDLHLYGGGVFDELSTPTRAWNPIYAFEILGIQAPSMDTAKLLFAGLHVTIFMGMFGLFTRSTCLLTALGLFYWSGTVYSFGKPHHDKIAYTFALFALTLGPVGARLSLDALIRRYRAAKRGGDPMALPQRASFAALPLRITALTLVIGYFASGMSKLIIAGPQWMNGYTLMGIMMGHDNEWSTFFSQSVVLCQVMSIMTIMVQVGFPLVMIAPKTRMVILPAAILFHLGTWKTMDTGPYITLWFLHIVFLPLEELPSRANAFINARPGWFKRGFALGLVLVLPFCIIKILSLALPWYFHTLYIFPLLAFLFFLRKKPRLAVIYDGSCGMCCRSMVVLDALDWGRNLEFHDFRDWERVHERFSMLDLERCELEIQVVILESRQIIGGFDAFRQLSWTLPLSCLFTPILYIPFVAKSGTKIYRKIAANRNSKHCGGDSFSTR